jgi:hypothetical protein
MFQVRPGVVRTASVAAVTASCLAAVACGSSGSSGAAASPSSTPNPLASLTAAQVQQKALADAEAAASLTMSGTVSESGQTYTVDLGIKRSEGCEGTIGVGTEGSIKIIEIGQTVYINPDKQFWTSNAGSEASAVIALVNGRYIQTTTSDKNVAGISDMCSVSQLLNPNSGTTTTGTVTKGPITTLNGTRVLELKVSDGSTEYVTDTSKPEFVEAVAPKGTKGGSGKVIVGVDAPVTLTAPPASQVLNGSQIDF